MLHFKNDEEEKASVDFLKDIPEGTRGFLYALQKCAPADAQRQTKNPVFRQAALVAAEAFERASRMPSLFGMESVALGGQKRAHATAFPVD